MCSVEYGASAEDLCTLYRDYGWWSDREESEVRRALRNTDETVVVQGEADDPVAAARVLTDYVYYAMVYDVLRSAQSALLMGCTRTSFS